MVDESNKKRLLLLGLSLLFFVIAIHPLFSSGIWTGSDWEAHAYRLSGVNMQIKNNQFPMIFDYWSNLQHGYAWSLFYPPLTTYLMALTYPLHYIGMSEVMQMKVVFFLLISFAFSCVVYSLRKLSFTTSASLLSAGLYVISPYFLTDIYVRFSLGEVAAMGFIPLFYLSLNMLLKGDRSFYVIFITSSSGILLSNIPSCVPVFLCALIFFIFNYKKIDILAVKRISISIFFIIGICAFYLFPLIYNFKYGDIYAFSGMSRNYEYMFNSAPNLYEAAIKGFTGSNNKYYLTLGIVQLIMTSVCLANSSRNIRICSATSLMLFMLSTKAFPWDMMSNSVPLINIMQFPWRFLSVSAFLSCVCTAYLLTSINKELFLTSCIIIAITSISVFSNQTLNKRDELIKNSFYPDYLNNTAARTDNFNYVKNAVIDKQKISLLKYENGYPVFKIESKSAFDVTLPILYYFGYEIFLDDNKIQPKNNRGLVFVNIPRGSEILKLTYNRDYIYASYLITMIAMFLGLFLYLKKPSQ